MHIQCSRLPKLTQLQTRFAASLGASLVLVAIYFILSSPRLAYAQEVDFAENVGRDTDSHIWKGSLTRDATTSRPAWDGGEAIDPWDEEMQAMVEDFGLPPLQAENMRSEKNELEVTYDVSGNEREEAIEKEEDLKEERKIEFIRRQATSTTSAVPSSSPTPLPGNNSPARSNITASQTQRWVFAREDVQGPQGNAGAGLPGGFTDFEEQTGTHEERERHKKLQGHEKSRRQSQKTVYISINTCTQPTWNGREEQPSPPQQLTLLVSSTSAQVGASNGPSDQIEVRLEEGFASANVTASGNVYVAVRSPGLTSGWTGSWTYSIAASIDDYYYSANDGLPPLYLVDTDTESALFVTDNVTQAAPDSEDFEQWMNLDPPPFTLFAQSNLTRTKIAGMRYSYCGLSTAADLQANPQTAKDENAPIQMQMITRGLGNKPKQQFYVRGLNGSSSYQAILAMAGNSTATGGGVIGGGGRVWTATNFTTKSGTPVLFHSLHIFSTNLSKTAIALSSSLCLSARRPHTPCPRTPSRSRTCPLSPTSTTLMPKNSTTISPSPSSSFPATPPPLRDTPFPKLVTTARELTKNGYARSPSPAAKTTARRYRTYSAAMLASPF